MSGMVLVRVVKRHGGYAPGDQTWLHASLVGPLVRAGLIDVLETVTPARQAVIEEMVQAPAPEMAVTRRRRRG
jgi:hypothetical protein